jgi:hypothetical protein
MVRKVLEYMYYGIYNGILKTNSSLNLYRTKSFLSICLFENIMTIFFFFENHLPKSAFYWFCGLGIMILLFILKYFDERKSKNIIREFESRKVNKIWKFLANFYPDLSVILFVVSIGANLSSIVLILGILIMIRGIEYFDRI